MQWVTVAMGLAYALEKLTWIFRFTLEALVC